MADKVKISISKVINPFAETKTKKVPAWFSCRPGLFREVAPLSFTKTMELDGRKWKKKVIEDGVYAIARYDLKLFATQLNSIEKSILDTLSDADRKKKAFPKSKNDESAKTKKALNDAEAKVKKLFKQMVGKVEDKVDLALEKIEDDKGDNKKAIAAGKQALKAFYNLETNGMFSKPVSTANETLKKLAVRLDPDDDNDDLYKAALADLRNCESNFEKTAKVTQKVAKFMLHLGEKMQNDKKADPSMQELGQKISGSGDIKKSLTRLVSSVDDLGDDLDMLVNFVAKGKATQSEVISRAQKFKSYHASKENHGKDAVKAVRTFAKDFDRVAKKLK